MILNFKYLKTLNNLTGIWHRLL